MVRRKEGTHTHTRGHQGGGGPGDTPQVPIAAVETGFCGSLVTEGST